MGLSQDLLRVHARPWSDLVGHDFFRLAEERLLPKQARDAYFLFERSFVDNAVVVFAHILTGAPDLWARRHLVEVLRGLVYDQVDLFDTILRRCGLVANSLPHDAKPAAVQALCDEMTEITRTGNYGAGLAAIFVAERSYLEVSRRLVAVGTGDAMLDDWFCLHTEAGFIHGVDWLGQEIDRLGEQGATVAQLAPVFQRAIALEYDFHSAALDNPLGTTNNYNTKQG